MSSFDFDSGDSEAVDQRCLCGEPLSEPGVPDANVEEALTVPFHSVERVFDAELIDRRVEVSVFDPQRHVESDPGPFQVSAHLRTGFICASVDRHYSSFRRFSMNSVCRLAARRTEYFLTHSEPSSRAPVARAFSRTSRMEPRFSMILPNTWGPSSAGSKPQNSPFNTQVVPQASASASAIPKLSLWEAATKKRARFKSAAIWRGERQLSRECGCAASMVDRTLT